jgi:hypothetical protein
VQAREKVERHPSEEKANCATGRGGTLSKTAGEAHGSLQTWGWHSSQSTVQIKSSVKGRPTNSFGRNRWRGGGHRLDEADFHAIPDEGTVHDRQ